VWSENYDDAIGNFGGLHLEVSINNFLGEICTFRDTTNDRLKLDLASLVLDSDSITIKFQPVGGCIKKRRISPGLKLYM
jgi:hypothetical protein